MSGLDLPGFGAAPVKREGAAIPFDAKARKGKPAPASDWMELNIPRKMSRKAVHRLVDKWLDGGRDRRSGL